MAKVPKYLCLICLKPVGVTVAMKYRKHNGETGVVCDSTGTLVPANQIDKGPVADGADADTPEDGRDFGVCSSCGKPCRLTLEVTDDKVYSAIPAHGSCIGRRYSYKPQAVDTLPGIEEYEAGMTQARDSMFQQPGAIPGTVWKPSFQQPGSSRAPKAAAEPMTGLALEVASRVKEIFYAYDNRKTSDNRSAQTTLGPSEIGSPCDRRIAMSLLGVPAVNPGGDGWAAFVGTSIHAGLADMFLWANSGTGRFAVEIPLEFGSALVPRGTGDLLDRTLCVFIDHKAQGKWSLDKLRTKGPSPTYRVQVHTYAYGARLKGEKVDHVAIVSWPREASSLDDLYVWTEPYDPTVARDALARVERIAAANAQWRDVEIDSSDCRFCSFHAPGDIKMERGCPGK